MTYQERLEDYDPNDISYDRLVDGEMSRDEYRQFLASLADEPGGWRRCALAFLEAQALGQDFASLTPDPAEARSRQPLFPRDRAVAPPSKVQKNWLTPTLAAAVCLLVAFLFGVLVRGWRPASDAIAPHDAQIVGRQQNSFRHHEVPGASPTLSDRTLPRTIRVVISGEQRELPVNVAEEQGDDWLENPQSVLPDHLIGAFERMGHDVQRRHHYFPFSLQNGRQLVVPVEEVEIVPVSRRLFQ